MKKWLSAILAACMLLGTLAIVGCANTNDPNADPSAKPTDDPSATGEPTVTEAPKLLPDLPDVNYGGEEFHFYQWDAAGWIVWNDLWVEDLTGETIDDAVVNRNNYIEEKYGIDITLTIDNYQTYENNVRQAVEVGDDVYDVIISMGHDIPRMYNANVFYNLYNIDHIDFEQPWWNQNANESFTLAGYMPFTVSDLTILDKAATAVCYFNKKVASDYNLGNLYSNVQNNTWTLETLIELGEKVAHDENGNDEWDDGDVYGLVSGDDPVEMLFHGFGCRYVSKDEDGYPELSFASQDNYNIIQNYLENLMFREDLAFDPEWKSDTKGYTAMFADDQGLFMIAFIRTVKSLQKMESDYGFLPIPKYDSEQESYHSSVSVFGGNLISVPLSCGDTDMVGVILEAMSAESKYTLIPAFYDTVLKDRSARDKESTEMLDIITGTMVFDVGDFYCLASFTDSFLRITGNAHDAGNNTPARTSNIASFWESSEGQVQAALEELIKVIDRWNELDY